jgi:PKD repeat protein
VSFTDQSTGTITSWDWDFGDGSAHSSQQNPIHEYAGAGDHTVTLTVSGPCGSDSETKTNYIHVGPTLIADFYGDSTSGCVPLTVNFTDQSTGEIATWDWDFGDGTPHSSEQNPTHVYDDPGDYKVKLIITGPCGSVTEIKTDCIHVDRAPAADFYVDRGAGTAPLTVSFYDQSIGDVTSWDWDFGDGTPHSNEQNPLHEYATEGLYTVSLTVTGPCGSDTETKADYIETISAVTTIYVERINIRTKRSWSYVGVFADLVVIDGQGNSISGAEVHTHWEGLANDSDVRGTNGAGKVRVYSDYKQRPCGWYYLFVDDVIKTDYTFDPVRGESRDSLYYCSGRAEEFVEVTEADEFILSQNYPNPFNPDCEIRYTLPKDLEVNLSVYNVMGQKVKSLVDDYQAAGHKTIHWDGTDDNGIRVASGIYFYRIQAGDFVETKKMLMTK